MANIKSQKKRILVSRKENARNVAMRTAVKNAIKKFNAAVANNDLALAEQLYPVTVGVINKAKSAGILHINTASRKIATLARSLDGLKAAR